MQHSLEVQILPHFQTLFSDSMDREFNRKGPLMMNARICAIIVLFEIFVSLRSRMINYLDIKFVKKGGEWYVQP